MSFKSFSIKKKLLLSFLAVILFLAAIVGSAVLQINRISRMNEIVYQNNIQPLGTLQAIKSDFVEMRRLASTAVMLASVGSLEEMNAAIKSTETRYAALQVNIQQYLHILQAIDNSNEEYNTVNAMAKEIADVYWPAIQEINSQVLARDFVSVGVLSTRLVSVADEINGKLNLFFEDKMLKTAEGVTEITTVSNRATLFLLGIGVVAIAVSIVLSLYMGASLSKRIAKLRRASKGIASGNLTLNLADSSGDDLGELSKDLVEVAESLNAVISGISVLSDEFDKGNISERIDTSDFQGAYKTIADKINVMIGDVVNDIVSFISIINEFSNGDFDMNMTTLPGGKSLMNESYDMIKMTLKSVVSDISELANAASAGTLSNKADISKYKGDWAKMMETLNNLMSAIAEPISESRRVLADVALGKFEQKVTGNYQGEFLSIKESVDNMITNMDLYIGEISETLNALAQNDLDQSIIREYVGKFSSIKDALNNIINNFNSVILNISNASEQVAVGARQISESSMSLAQGATEQAAAIEELNATVQVINQSTIQNAEHARSANDLSRHLKNNAASGDEQMRHMLGSIESIKESSNSISKIIQVIDDIAFQTNLLALNAAVEAARAGAQGKGFAVVAEEVRNLAGRSQNAAKETAILIEDSIAKVNEGTEIADLTAQALRAIVEDVDRVDEIISSIAQASDEQMVAISQVVEGLSQITDVVQDNSTTSQEAASASEELSSQSDLLKKLVDVFKLKKSHIR